MTMTENRKILLNRIVSFGLGGLLVFALMSFTVVNGAKAENQRLSAALDTSQYEAGRLLEDAKAQFAAGDFTKAQDSLKDLFENQPGSEESVEGKILLASVVEAQTAADNRWEEALPAIRAEWSNVMSAELRAKSDAERAELESSMEKTIADAWQKAMPKIRTEWELEG
jgi:hypothetical protein